jgi:putative heme degradation protein
LQGDSAELRIDAARIDSAWVLKVPGEKAEQASLRLYDHQGRSLANIAAVLGFDHGENPIWRTLINALLD